MKLVAFKAWIDLRVNFAIVGFSLKMTRQIVEQACAFIAFARPRLGKMVPF